MTTPPRDDRWERLDDALLRLMGCEFRPAGPEHFLLRLLIQPAFIAPCCVSFDDRGGSMECGLTILRDRRDDVFATILAAATGAPVPPGLTKPRCFEDAAEVRGDERRRLLAAWEALDPEELRPCDPSRSRDGTGFALLGCRAGETRVARVDNPNFKTTPTHHELILGAMTAAMAAFPEEPTFSYLWRLSAGLDRQGRQRR